VARARIGSSSWKYDSWEGLVYTPGSPESYLAQYARSFDTVEIDQWFWSLFESPTPRLPEPAAAAEYAASVPEDFRFTIKVPNSITLTHHYAKGRAKTEALRPNPHFLSRELFAAFLERIRPLHGRVGALIFQFEYLNRQKIASQEEFHDRFGEFASGLRCPLPCAVEVRNPKWLNDGYLDLLGRCGFAPCLLQGYYMPDLREVVRSLQVPLQRCPWLVLRLHGPDRQGIEESSGGRWDRVIAPKDAEIEELSGIVSSLLARGLDIYLNVNNHYEGSAPLSIAKIRAAIERRSQSPATDP
jgi:uncharacterized protein YecE (DUF72 family)